MSPESESILKHNDKRTVRVERLTRHGSTLPVVTKHFHDPNPLHFARDFFRARGEFRVLRSLARAGVAVPEALRLHRRGRGWQIVMQWIPDAVALEDWLLDRRRDTLPADRVATELGRLLAGVQNAGLEHGNLQADNVLLDRSCRAWILDFHESKVRANLTGPQIRAQLVGVTGQLRELVPPAFRARAFLAWLRALDHRLRLSTGADRTWMGPIEARARFHRRAAVDDLLGRWLRRIARRAERRDGDLVTLADECAPGEVAALLEAGRDRGDAGESRRVWAGGEYGRFLITHGRTGVLRADLIELRRLWTHCLPVLEPVLLVEGRDSFCVYRLPEGASMAHEPGVDLSEHVAALGRLIGLVHDRGWQPQGITTETLVLDANGTLHLGPGIRCDPFDPIPDGSSQTARFAALAELALDLEPSGTNGPALMSGYYPVFVKAVRRALAATLSSEQR